LAVVAGCSEPAVESTEPGAPREVSGLTIVSRNGELSAVIPSAFVVHRQDAAIVATTADGSGRIYVGSTAAIQIPAFLGGFKDELRGLGAEVLEEKHFERATRLVSDEGPRNARQRRRTWLVEDGRGGVIICEAFFQSGAEAEWAPLIDALCLKAKVQSADAPAEVLGPDAVP